MTGPVAKIALVAAIPIFLWGTLEISGLLKIPAAAVPQKITAQPAPPVPASQPAAFIEPLPKPQKIRYVDSLPPENRRRSQRLWIPAKLSQIMQMASAIKKYARAYGVDEKLVWAVVRRESGFNPAAVSPKGAMGLMQLMPATATAVGVNDPFDVEQNIAGGIKYLVSCLKRFDGDVELALAAYNSGPDNVIKYQGCPPFAETVQYVAAVMRDYARPKNFALKPLEPVISPVHASVPENSGLHWNLPIPVVKAPTPQWHIAPPQWNGVHAQNQAQMITARLSVPTPENE